MVFSPEDMGRYDWQLLQNGAVNLYWRMDLFHSAIDRLVKLKYKIIKIHFDNVQQFRHEVSVALKWHDQFGYALWNGSLNALDDALGDQPFESADDSAFCVDNFDALASFDKELSLALLDMIERHSRDYLLFGKRLIGLIQTNDPAFQCEGIGGTCANWNEAESLKSARGL